MRDHVLNRWRKRLRRRWKHRPGFAPWVLSLPPRALLFALRLLPPGVALFLAEWAGRAMWVLPARRRIGHDHIAQAFPALDARARARIGRQSCGAMARNVAETLVLGPRLTPEDVVELATYEEGVRELFEAQRGRGAVFVQGHYGSMEGMDGLLGALGLRLLTVIRLPTNHYLARALLAGREGWGVDLVRRDGALQKLRTRLAEGGSVMLPMDVNARRGGIFVDWFGRPASTEPAAAWLALRTGRPLIVCWGIRGSPRGTWRIGATLVRAERAPEKPTDAALHAVTEDIHRALESAIRLAPEQYFWIHDRYRTRPPASA